MKKIKFLIVMIGIITLSGCTNNKQKLIEYLKENKYEENNNCWKKNQEEEIIKFCLEECKIYSSNTSLEDYFVLDLKTKNIQYIYSYITYQSSIKDKEETCLFQGEEIDLESSYCKNAKKAFNEQLNSIEKETKKAKVSLKNIC